MAVEDGHHNLTTITVTVAAVMAGLPNQVIVAAAASSSEGLDLSMTLTAAPTTKVQKGSQLIKETISTMWKMRNRTRKTTRASSLTLPQAIAHHHSISRRQ